MPDSLSTRFDGPSPMQLTSRDNALLANWQDGLAIVNLRGDPQDSRISRRNGSRPGHCVAGRSPSHRDRSPGSRRLRPAPDRGAGRAGRLVRHRPAGSRRCADARVATATGRPACCRHRCEQWLCRAAPGGTAGARRPCAGLSAGPASAHLQNRSVCRIALLQGVCLDLAKRRGVFIRTAGAPKFRRLCPPDAGARHARPSPGSLTAGAGRMARPAIRN